MASPQYQGIKSADDSGAPLSPGSEQGHRIPRKSIPSATIDDFGKKEKSHVFVEKTLLLNSKETNTTLRQDTLKSNPQLPTRQRRRWRPLEVAHWWYFEILACLATLASLAAQIAVLWYFDGRPQKDWPSEQLTLNGFVAILTTVYRTCFMLALGAAIGQIQWNWFSGKDGMGSYHPLNDFAILDGSANGGIRASLKVLWRWKGGHIACLGALLTLLSLGVDFFAQQVLDTRIDQVADATKEKRTYNVDRAHWVDSVTGFSNSMFPSTATKLAIHNGFIAPTMELPAVVCPTGNCTWPIVPTVGVCGACVNLTDEIVIVNRTAPLCTVMTSGGLEIQGRCESTDYATVWTFGPGSGRVFANETSETVLKRKGKTDLHLPLRDSPNIISEFGAIGVPASKLPFGMLPDSLAAECGLWYCLQAHNISITKGELSDKVVETWSKAAIPDDDFGTLNRNVTFKDVPKSFNLEPKVDYGLGGLQMSTLQNYANRTFYGNVSSDGLLMVVNASTEYAEGLHNSFHEIDKWMDRLTLSMTNEIRYNRGNISRSKEEAEERFKATVLHNQVIVVVRWPWIIYPAVLVIASIAYLGLEMILTEFGGAQPWRQDDFLKMCLVMDDEVVAHANRGLHEPEGIEKYVADYQVGLRRMGRDGLEGPLGLARAPSQ